MNIKNARKKVRTMAITKNFKETIKARALRDHEFREGLLREGMECLLSGEIETGKSILRDYINATLGFEELGHITSTSPKSLMRMFSPKGNPTASNLFTIIKTLQQKEGIEFHVEAVR